MQVGHSGRRLGVPDPAPIVGDPIRGQHDPEQRAVAGELTRFAGVQEGLIALPAEPLAHSTFGVPLVGSSIAVNSIRPPAAHLDELESRLAVWSDRVRESLADTSRSDEQHATEFVGWVAAQIRERLAPADAVMYEWGTTAINSWHGLARYWRATTGDSPR